MLKKNLICFIIFLSFTSCNFFYDGETVEIYGEEVEFDETTKMFLYKENENPVTGTVVFYALDSITGEKYKEKVRKARYGKCIKKGYDYYPSGAILHELQFDKNGMVSGTIKSYYENGQLCQVAKYKDNKLNGITKSFDEYGHLIGTFYYMDGKKNGLSKIYENRRLKASAEYKDDKRNGIIKLFDENGIIIFEQIFVDDNVIEEYGYYKGKKCQFRRFDCYKYDFFESAYKSHDELLGLNDKNNIKKNNKRFKPYVNSTLVIWEFDNEQYGIFDDNGLSVVVQYRGLSGFYTYEEVSKNPLEGIGVSSKPYTLKEVVKNGVLVTISIFGYENTNTYYDLLNLKTE